MVITITAIDTACNRALRFKCVNYLSAWIDDHFQTGTGHLIPYRITEMVELGHSIEVRESKLGIVAKGAMSIAVRLSLGGDSKIRVLRFLKSSRELTP